MSTHKSIDRICCVVIILGILLSCAMAFGKSFGIQAQERVLGYETRLFDTSSVHTIDIEMDDWDSFIASCENEAYAPCTVVIDNESKKNVAIRAKGNTSLSNVRQLGSQRYSFKIEFDHYESGKTYHGLDKLSLNNLIQDNTMMKDYLCYQLMAKFGADAPLCSYAFVTVNGEDWGLYLAVEGVEDSFLSRTHDGEGELYKPDSMDMGGGRGNGREFEFDSDVEMPEGDPMGGGFGGGQKPQMPDGEAPQMPNGEMPQMPNGKAPQMSNSEAPQMPNGEAPQMSNSEAPQMPNGEAPQMPNGDMPQMPNGDMPQMPNGEAPQMPNGDMPQMPNGKAPQMPDGEMPQGGMGGPGGGKGSADVKLQYIDNDPDSYANIFDNAKTEVTEADKKRLIASLKKLSEGEDLEDILDIDRVLRYFVVHDFVCNGDSYTGSMIHNYYLYENSGKLSMIPWDYNLAFGGFQSFSAASTVNEPIDSPVSEGNAEDRPMAAWFLDGGTYQAQYHALYAQFLDSVDFSALISETQALIAPYVEKDPTKFCTLEEFEKGAAALSEFCTLRAESVRGQLDGSIPSTSEGQSADSSSLIDTGDLSITDMGSMQAGMGQPGGQQGEGKEMTQGAQMPQGSQMQQNGGAPQGGPGGFMPQNGGPDGMPNGMPGAQGSSLRSWLIVGICAVVLLLGILVTKLFRRR